MTVSLAIRPVMLAEDTIAQSELLSLCEWISAGNRLTKAEQTLAFEKEFSEWMGCRNAIFVNSGSSANLLMIYALQEAGLLKNKKAIAPAVSWVTTVTPLLQFGFDVELCDCDPTNLGLDLNHLEQLCKTHNPSVLILVHVLGHANHLSEIQSICDRYGVLLLEDSCEALGSTLGEKKLGTFGIAGSFSFYYGHHISTIEGGIVVTDNVELHSLMLSLRSHGWARDIAPERRQALATQYGIDEFRNLYTFYNTGFNFRSTDLQAFVGRSQLKKLDDIVETRELNFQRYKERLSGFFCQSGPTGKLSSFAYGTFVDNRLEVFHKLREEKIECRPLICGNIARHPFWIDKMGPRNLPNADKVHDFGIYLPNHHNVTESDIERIASVFHSVAVPA